MAQKPRENPFMDSPKTKEEILLERIERQQRVITRLVIDVNNLENAISRIEKRLYVIEAKE